MKVAVDTGPLKSGHKIRGIGVNTRELISALRTEIKNSGDKDIKIFPVDFSNADLSKYDVVHYQFFNPFFATLPGVKPTKTVVTIHDLIPLIYPDHYPPGTKGQLRFLRQKYFLKNVDAIVTISETSKKDICRFLGVAPRKVKVAHLAPGGHFKNIDDNEELLRIKKKYDLPETFVLYVGDINFNKNIPTLVEACKIAKIPLVICGKQALEIEGKGIDIYSLKGPRDWMRFLFGKAHPEIAHYQEVLSKVRGYKEVKRLGFVPDKDLATIYNLASLYCQPSFYEGFGLPILEAEASGCPVVASRNQVHVEIAEGSALFAMPSDAKDFADKFKKILKDEKTRNDLVKSGLTNVEKYSWQKTASSVLGVYKSLK